MGGDGWHGDRASVTEHGRGTVASPVHGTAASPVHGPPQAPGRTRAGGRRGGALCLLIACLAPAIATAQAGRDARAPTAPPTIITPDSAMVTVEPDAELALGAVGVRRDADALAVDLDIDRLFDSSTMQLIEDGVPVTVMVDIELWRERGIWFDDFERSQHLVFRIQRDAWDEIYEVARLDESGRRVSDYATLREAAQTIAVIRGIDMGPFDELEREKPYYVVVSAALKPMSLEDVDKLESWLAGDLKQRRPSGFGLLGLPRQLLGVLFNLTGLHDQRDALRTRTFRYEEADAGLVLGNASSD